MNTISSVLVTATLAVVLLASAGCESFTGSDAPATGSLAAEFSGFAPDNSEYVAIQAMSDDEREAYGSAKSEEHFRLTQGLAAASDWAEADAFVQEELARESVTPNHQRKMTASVTMLRQHLLPAAVTPERQAALAKYAEMAVESGSANAGVIDRTLLALDDDVSAATAQRIASKTLALAERAVDRRVSCEDCSLDEKLARLPAADQSAVLSTEVADRLAARAAG